MKKGSSLKRVRRVLVTLKRWQTIGDMRKRPERWRLAYDAVIVFSNGTRVRTTRLSEALATELLRAGADFEEERT